ncbi:YaiI/YqxD family protein [Halalkalibacterium ligniniphilum]|uniref:YaiI/YqxD family protein n=1 Tax=Halalkalibacterium ligniniphilum TaxID=1134413 RepID=UPI00034B0674|nr:YaiI/YqxD family protein [Halalkalibacterium ligniniphilum]
MTKEKVENKLQIYVDADSCPVKNEIETVATEFECEITFVSSYAHQLAVSSSSKVVTVDADREAADLYIANHCYGQEICITQDYGLAALLLPKKVIVLSPRGERYTESRIEQMLDARHHSQKQRRAGGKTKGPKKFTFEDRQRFLLELKKILAKEAGKPQKNSKLDHSSES